MDYSNSIRLAQIIPESIVDGPGIRYVLFSQGCKHNCKGCFNQQTHSFEGGKLYNINDIITEIKKNPLLRGVTFSGGDPFEQAEKFSKLAKELHILGLDIWSYTGYTFEHLISNVDKSNSWHDLLTNIDVLVDGRFEEDKKNILLKFRGSSNQRIINVPKSLNQGCVVRLTEYEKTSDEL